MCFVGAEYIHYVRKKVEAKETTLKRWLSLSAEDVVFHMNTAFFETGALAGCLT